MKICIRCSVEKPLEGYHNDKRNKDGKDNCCKECKKAVANQWYKDNTEKAKARVRARACADPERKKAEDRAYYEKNKEKFIAKAKEWSKNNPHAGRAAWARYHANKLNATASWANLAYIRELYKKAKAYGMHVDHIVPLQNDKVCGLHCEDNLQLLYPEVNRAKSNKLEW